MLTKEGIYEIQRQVVEFGENYGWDGIENGQIMALCADWQEFQVWIDEMEHKCLRAAKMVNAVTEQLKHDEQDIKILTDCKSFDETVMKKMGEHIDNLQEAIFEICHVFIVVGSVSEKTLATVRQVMLSREQVIDED